MPSSMKWHGAKVKTAVRDGGADGIEAAGRDLFEATQQAVPEATGELKRSGKLTLDGLHADITYGEGLPDARASIIHEKLEIRHSNGTAKYLENPTTAAAPRFDDILAAAIRRKL